VGSAVERAAAQPEWGSEADIQIRSGTVVRASNVAFYGTLVRWSKAVDAETGELLRQFRDESGIVAQPVTYLGPDGRQYVAIASGVGGWAGAVVSGGLDPNVPFGALGFVNAVQDLPQHTAPGGTLYVFALPERTGAGAAGRAQNAPPPGAQGQQPQPQPEPQQPQPQPEPQQPQQQPEPQQQPQPEPQQQSQPQLQEQPQQPLQPQGQGDRPPADPGEALRQGGGDAPR